MRSNFKPYNSNTSPHKNTIINKNSETYNTHIFDRNLLSSELLSSNNKCPVYFNEDHKKNRKDAEDIFNKRFEPLNNLSGGKLGYVDFTDKDYKTKNKEMNSYKFNGNYNKYLDNLAPVNHSPFMQTKENKR